MNEPALPSPGAAALVVLGALPFLALVLRAAARMLPPRAAPAHRWPSREGLAVIAAPFLVLFAFAWFAGSPGASEEEGDGRLGLATLLASQLLLGSAGALAVVLAARRRAGIESLGIARRLPLRALAAVPLVYVPLFVVMLGLGIAWRHVCRANGWEDEQDVVRLILGLERHELVVAAVVAVIAAPLIEELVFRGFLQSFLAQVLGERQALVLASALFASLHGLAVLPLLFVLSLFLGWLQLRTRCLWVPWFAHALNNGVMLALALASTKLGV